MADSALATEENLHLLMTEPALSFITRLPDKFNLCAELKEEAYFP